MERVIGMAKSEEASSSSSFDRRPWESYHTVYTNAKAGMEGVDKEKVQRLVYEMSKGSKYFQNEERKEAYMKLKIQNMRAHRANLSPTDLSHYQSLAHKKIAQLEATRDLTRTWLHVDMDAFYAAVETLSNPSLQGRPMAVGTISMISTANYEARKFGVRAAMPGFIACKLCPELIFVPTDFKKYTYYSDLTRKVFQIYDPNFMAASLDEAYLDITNVCKQRDMTAAEVTEELRQNVYKATGLTCSAGVAPNRLLAKVCSDINKPNGQFLLPHDRAAIMTFISSLPIRKIGGIGKVTEHILKDVFEIKTCEDLLRKSSFLCALFSPSSADFFISVGLGLGGTDAPQVRSRKSMSNERTFSATKDETFFHQKLVELSEMLSADMEKEGLHGRTLTLKLKTASFEVKTRALTLQSYIRSSEDILKHASKLLKAELPVSLRLIGLRMSHFNEDKDGTPSDRTQRTLLNYIKPGDIMNLVDEEHSGVKDDSELHCYSYTDPSRDHLSELNDSSEQVVEHNDLEDHECKNQINENAQAGNVVKSFEFDAQGTETHSLEGRNQDQLTMIDVPKNETGSSSSHYREALIWLEDYKCSLCGVELPSSFLEERQEHADFHLAEKMQMEEESAHSYRNLPIKNRMRQKDAGVGQSKGKKKPKPSPSNSKHIPIDAFFTKASQNL